MSVRMEDAIHYIRNYADHGIGTNEGIAVSILFLESVFKYIIFGKDKKIEYLLDQINRIKADAKQTEESRDRWMKRARDLGYK